MVARPHQSADGLRAPRGRPADAALRQRPAAHLPSAGRRATSSASATRCSSSKPTTPTRPPCLGPCPCAVTADGAVRVGPILAVGADDALLHRGTADGDARRARSRRADARRRGAQLRSRSRRDRCGARGSRCSTSCRPSASCSRRGEGRRRSGRRGARRQRRGAATGSTRTCWIESPRIGSAMMIDAEGRDAIVAPMMAFGRATGSGLGRNVAARAARRRTPAAAARRRGAGRGRARAERARRRGCRQTNELLQAEINLDHNMVGRSRPMRALFDRIARVARTDSTVLLRGRERHRQGAGRARRAPQQRAAPTGRSSPSTARR